MPTPGLSSSDEAYINRLDRIRQTSRVPVRIATAQNVAALARVYPGMSPGIVYALAKQGVRPGAQAQQIWQADLASQLNREPGTKPQQSRKKKPKEDSGGGGLLDVLDYVPVAGAVKGIVEGEDPSEILTRAIPGAKFTTEAWKQASESGVPVVAPVAQEVQNVAKAGTRYATAAGMAGLEALIGGLRVGPGNPQTQPSLSHPFQQIEDIAQQTTIYHALKGEDLGQGYLPSWDSEAMKAQAEDARKFSPYLIGGHAWTPGRAIADTVFEPDDVAFQATSGFIDGSIAISKLDPAGFGLAKLGEAARAGKRFATAEEATRALEATPRGAIASTIDRALNLSPAIRDYRKKFSPRLWSEWRNTEDVQRMAQRVAEETSALNIHHALDIPYSFTLENGREFPIVQFLRDTNDPEEVLSILEAVHGTYLRDVPKWGKTAGAPRALTSVPKNYIPGNPDINDLAKIGDDALVNARVPYSAREEFANLAAEAVTRPQQVAALELHADIMKNQLIHVGGYSPEKATEMTRYWKDDIQKLSTFMYDDLGKPLTTPGIVTLDGVGQPVPHVMLPSQLLARGTKLPDAREVRRAVSDFSRAYNSGLINGATDIGDAVLVPWRKLMLMRAAWGVRVVGEEQIRLATQVNSLFHHPLYALGWIVGNPDSHWLDKMEAWSKEPGLKGFIGPLGEEAITKIKGRYGRGWDPGLLDDAMFRDSQYRRFDEVRGRKDKIYLNNYAMIDSASELGPTALAENLVELYEDGLARGLLHQPDLASARAWFWNGDGANIREYLAKDPTLAHLTDETIANAHVDTVLEGIDVVTGHGNPILREAAMTGKIDGKPLMIKGEVNQDVIPDLRAIIDDPLSSVPPRVKIREFHTLTSTEQQRFMGRLSYAFDALFDALMPRPSDYLSRNPAFRQYSWARKAELISENSPEDRLRIIDDARTQNIDGKIINRMIASHERMNRVADHVPRLTYKATDDLAKVYGLKETKALLYDLTERGQIFDSLRFAAPFGEAWREVLTTWARIARENPQVFRRATQVLMGAQSPGSDVINELTGNPAAGGFFHKDAFGQEVFSFPGSGILTKELLGVPVPLKGSVQGLNIVGNGLPGLGPYLQLPLAYLLQNKPDADFLKAIVMPYGPPNPNPVLGGLESFAPTWFKNVIKAFQDPSSSREFGAVVAGMMRYYASTGDYDLQGPNASREMTRLVADSTNSARWFQVIRAAGSFTLPSSPSPEWLTHDKKGKLTLAWRLSKWYHDKLQSGMTPEEALDAYLDKFGPRNILQIQGRSSSVIPAAHRIYSSAGSKWLARNPDLKSLLPTTYALFAPDAGEMDSAAYERAISSGAVKALTPTQMLEAVNSRLANALYYNARDALIAASPDGKIDPADAAELLQTKRDLAREFPGYDPDRHDRPSPERLIAELYRASEIPKIRATPAGKALNAYLTERNIAIRNQADVGLSTSGISTSKRSTEVRAWLKNFGEKLVERHPTFQPIWDYVLSREVDK